MTKSEIAFRMTANSLQEKGFRVYFWTFTFSCLQADWDAAKLFSAFLDHLRKVCGSDIGGVRVAELHKEHGVHYHALINRRIPVDIVRRIGRCHGIGRVHVSVARERAVHYLAKYLSKSKEGPLCKSGRKGRRWASFGRIVKTRVSDLVNESPVWIFRRSRGLRWLGYRWEVVLLRCWDWGESVFQKAWQMAMEGNMEACMRLATGKATAHFDRSGVCTGVLVHLPSFVAQPF